MLAIIVIVVVFMLVVAGVSDLRTRRDHSRVRSSGDLAADLRRRRLNARAGHVTGFRGTGGISPDGRSRSGERPR